MLPCFPMSHAPRGCHLQPEDTSSWMHLWYFPALLSHWPHISDTVMQFQLKVPLKITSSVESIDGRPNSFTLLTPAKLFTFWIFWYGSVSFFWGGGRWRVAQFYHALSYGIMFLCHPPNALFISSALYLDLVPFVHFKSWIIYTTTQMSLSPPSVTTQSSQPSWAPICWTTWNQIIMNKTAEDLCSYNLLDAKGRNHTVAF